MKNTSSGIDITAKNGQATIEPDGLSNKNQIRRTGMYGKNGWH
jgi:hypothetical protein